jgi:hypothetical protein
MVERFGAIVRWNPDFFTPAEFRTHITQTGSSSGLTWLCHLKHIQAGDMIVVIGPKGTPYSGIVAIGEALGPREMGRGLTGGKDAWRIPVSLRSANFDLELLRDDIENLVQGPIYLNAEEYHALIGNQNSVGDTFRTDIEMEDSEKTPKMFIFDNEGRFVDSSFYSVRQGNHVAIHTLSFTTGFNSEMKKGKCIMLERIRDNGYEISGILTGSTARNRTTGRPYSPLERIVREGAQIQLPTGNLQEYADELWKEAKNIASASDGSAGNHHRPLRIYLHTNESPMDVLRNLVSGQKNVKPIKPAKQEKVVEVNRSSRELRARTPVSAEVLRGGYVYLLQNPSWPGWIKIGKAANLENRLSSFNTSAPHTETLFEYITWFESDFALDIEQAVHAYLSNNFPRNPNQPTRNGEWYFIEQKLVIQTIQQCWRD